MVTTEILIQDQLGFSARELPGAEYLLLFFGEKNTSPPRFARFEHKDRAV